jgi:transposase-like protein
MNTERVTRNPEEFTRKERARIVLGLLCGEMNHEEACERFGVDRQTLEAWEEAYLEAIDGPARPKVQRRQRSPRWLAAAATVLAVSGSGLWVYASGQNCAAAPMICFNPGEPATADDVNQNFKTLRDWLVNKVGPTNESRLTVSDGSAWGVHVGQRDGDGVFGLRFFDNPGGGSGDTAWVKYMRDGTGEDLSLQIGVANDANDDISFVQGGQTRLKIENSQVQVLSSSLTTSGAATIGGALTTTGNATIGGTLTTNGNATINGTHNVVGNMRVRGNALVQMRRYSLGRDVATIDTGIEIADWDCSIAGVNFYDGDIQENDRGAIMRLWTYPGGTSRTRWWIMADFRSHNTNELKHVGLICFRKEITDRVSWWADATNN